MRTPILTTLIAATAAAAAFAFPAQALGPASVETLAPTAPIEQVSAARDRRLMMMGIIQQQQMRGYRRGYGGGYGRGYGGYGRGYGAPYGNAYGYRAQRAYPGYYGARPSYGYGY